LSGDKFESELALTKSINSFIFKDYRFNILTIKMITFRFTFILYWFNLAGKFSIKGLSSVLDLPEQFKQCMNSSPAWAHKTCDEMRWFEAVIRLFTSSTTHRPPNKN
jgi:hypothetical protein